MRMRAELKAGSQLLVRVLAIQQGGEEPGDVALLYTPYSTHQVFRVINRLSRLPRYTQLQSWPLEHMTVQSEDVGQLA